MAAKMIFHVFNSSLISGPETLVFPALAVIKERVKIILLREERISAEKQKHVEDYLKQLSLPYVIIPVRSRHDGQAVRDLAAFLQSHNEMCEIVHAHDVKPSFYLWEALRFVSERRFAIVSTHHGVFARSGFINRFYEWIYVHFILPRFDRVLTVCTTDRDCLVEDRGLPADLVKVHLNGVTRSKISILERPQRQQQIRESWGLEADKSMFVFGVAARLAPEKRHSLILEAAAILKELKPSLRFRILCFGRGELEDRLYKKTQALGLQQEVLWKGYRAGLGEEFCGFDAVLSLSVAEGLPINLIEAGWAATPIFSTAVNGVCDLVPSDSVGELVEVNESARSIAKKMLRFASLPKVRLSEMGAAFQRHVEANFSQEVWLNQLLDIYSETINERKDQ